MAVAGSGSEIKQNHFILVLNFAVTFCIALVTLFSLLIAVDRFEDISMMIDSEIETRFKRLLSNAHISKSAKGFMKEAQCCGWFDAKDFYVNQSLPESCCLNSVLNSNSTTVQNCTFSNAFKVACYFRSKSLFEKDMKVINGLATGLIISSLVSCYTSFIISINIREFFFFK